MSFQTFSGSIRISIMFIWLRRHWFWAALLLGVGAIAYKSRQGVPLGKACWSPNHEYFMVRRQALTSTLYSEPGFEIGWVLIYDKHGNVVHRWDGELNPAGGPFWRGKSVTITSQPEASLDLPTDGGEGDLNRNCY